MLFYAAKAYNLPLFNTLCNRREKVFVEGAKKKIDKKQYYRECCLIDKSGFTHKDALSPTYSLSFVLPFLEDGDVN